MARDLPDPSTVYHIRGRAPFDPQDPPAEPPEACLDPALWRVAHALHRAHRPGEGGRCGCGEPHPCEEWWQAVAALHGACARIAGAPRAFVLCDEDGDVIAYGMTLPDGSAVTAQWTDGSYGSVGVWSSPGVPARLWSCGLAWFDRPVAPPRAPS